MSDDVRQEEDIGAEYASSLADLTVNSKPLINMLTMLAEDHVDSAAEIVTVIEKHLAQVYIILSFHNVFFSLISIIVGDNDIIHCFVSLINLLRNHFVVMMNTWSNLIGSKARNVSTRKNIFIPGPF